jgi:hypothetical protein
MVVLTASAGSARVRLLPVLESPLIMPCIAFAGLASFPI